MRYTIILLLLFYPVSAMAADTVQLSKSSYFDQHVTAEDRDDHYVIHFNVYYRLEEPISDGELRFLHASVAISHGEALSDVSREKRSVQLSKQEGRWSFYFRVPKFPDDQANTLYAVTANVDGVQREAVAVWRFTDNGLNLGSKTNPLAMQYPVGRTIMQEVENGGFRLVVVYAVKEHVNNYDDLPTCGFLKADKEMPDKIDGERSAKRLSP